GNVLQGAVYDLLTEDGDNIAEGLETDEAGQISVAEIPVGSYQLIETSAPFGYELDEEPILFEIEKGQEETLMLIHENVVTPGSVLLTKVDQEDKSTMLADAVFTLVDSEGNVIVESLKTDENGQIQVDDLTPGDYRFIETNAPKDYLLDETPVAFTIEKGQSAPLELIVENGRDPNSDRWRVNNNHNEDQGSDQDSDSGSSNGNDSANNDNGSKNGNNSTNSENKGDNNFLPVTSNPMYNWIVAGVLLIVASMITLYIMRTRRVREE
ncbi:collagen binding domain-containing protein, partial [Anaerobacillus sp. 1_MG-2023]|uniref:MSCRAMM family protein n=1 Tax=Anaerobacillus sp. 1_MG-2023 TaxID=3062655 RepID=UPI0026E2AD09